jgi:hypothetical protein
MPTLKWHLHKYVVMFYTLFPTLDRGPNRAHVDQAQVNVG